MVPTEPVEFAQVRQQLASMLQIAGRPGEALPLLETARTVLRHRQASLSLQISQSAAKQKNHLTALTASEQAFHLAPDSTRARSEFAAELVRNGRPDEAASLLKDCIDQPDYLIVATQLATRKGDLTSARTYANQLFDQLIRSKAKSTTASYSLRQIAELAQSLLDLNLYEDAATAAEKGLQSYPTSLELLDVLSQAYRASGQPTLAAKAAYLAASMAPHRIELHRLLADVLEETGDWIGCLGERNQVLKMNPAPLTDDLLAAAASAIRAGRTEEAIAACQAILERDPDSGLAQAYYGEALAKKGEIPAAVQRLTQATLLAPDQSQPWISLSNLHELAGDHRKAMETLRSASHAAPQTAEIQLALAQACLAEGSPSEALPALRRAVSLAPQTSSVAQRLGQTLFDLGHLEEASQVVERARYTWPTLPGLALCQAKILIGLGDIQAAIPALETVLHSQPNDIEPYLLYGRSVVTLSEQASTNPAIRLDLASVRQHMLKALAIDSENYEARLLMAEVQTAGGDLSEALATYQELSEMEKANDPTWSWRIHLGMGRVAMDLGQMDTAIAALQEAVQTRPDDLRIHQALAEAYHAANLTEEALIKARTALGMAPHNVANLIWYARIAVAMKDEGEAINALEHAIELAPERAGIRNHLALVQLQINDRNAARKTLESILSLENVDQTDLRATASHFLALGDQNNAVACLKQAIEHTPQTSADLWAELASLQHQIGDHPSALDAIRTALEIRPSDPCLHTLHGNLLTAENKTQAAISCYEQALNLSKTGEGSPSSAEVSGWSYPPENNTPIRLHLQIAGLLRSTGDLRSALSHSEQAIHLEPDNLEARYAAAETAYSLLELDKASDLVNWAPLNALPTEFNPGMPVSLPKEITNRQTALRLLTLQAELFLETYNQDMALNALSRAKVFSSDDARLCAAMARIAAWKGELAEGSHLLENAIAGLQSSIHEGIDGHPTLSIAEAALALGQWKIAIPLFHQTARNLPLEPLAQLALARSLVKAVEAQRVYMELGATQHAPGIEKCGEAAYQQFEQAILAANRLSNSDLVAVWHKRGQAAFHPAEKTMKSLQTIASTPDDLAALMAAGLLADRVVPVELADRFPNHPSVLLQKSLSQQNEHPEDAFITAQTLVTIQPDHPLYQALLAKIAMKVANPVLACQAIEAALSTWPDEPAWHALAAESSAACNDRPRSLDHWKLAYDQDPENPEYAHTLGEAYLLCGDVTHAIQTLNHAADAQPDRLETWIALGDAHRIAEDYPQAIACAEKAISLAPNQVAPILASGEIALAAGEPDLAKARAEAALSLKPGHPKAILLIARALVHQGHPSEALRTVETALAQTIDSFELLLERTRLIHSTQGAASALQALQELAQQFPEEALAQAELAASLAEAGQKEAAEKAAQAALLLEPDLPSLHLLLGRIQRTSGQLDQAIHHLSEAIRQDGHNIDAYLELGRTHQDRREHDQALKIYEQASMIAPRDARLFYQSGLAMKEMKDYPNAELMLRKAAQFAPEDLNIRRQLAAMIAINLVHNPQEASIHE
ncbi:MAG: tetratricopeptide repeat protein [Anaerolineaceae bacterium]|nr:tetratricopeptide repeat protein [Anaerolineaceae bacterium]